jgi:SAM-dependent methyltransferase
MSKAAYLRIVSDILSELESPRAVLEAGVGVGETGVAVAALLTSQDVLHAVDLDANNVTNFARRLEDESIGCRIGTLVTGDLRNLQVFNDGSFDAICCDTVMAMLGADLDLVLTELQRTLRPGGVLCLRELLPPVPSAGRYRDLFLQVVLSARALRPEPYLMLPPRLVAAIAVGCGFRNVTWTEEAGATGSWAIEDWFPLSQPDSPMRDHLLRYFHDHETRTASTGSVADSYVLTARN